MRPIFHLVISDIGSVIPTEQRLRAVLKRLLRSYAFRCDECKPVTEQTEPQPTEPGIEQLREFRRQLESNQKPHNQK